MAYAPRRCGLRSIKIGKVLGECDENPTLEKWCNPAVPFLKRWNMLHRPNGMRLVRHSISRNDIMALL